VGDVELFVDFLSAKTKGNMEDEFFKTRLKYYECSLSSAVCVVPTKHPQMVGYCLCKLLCF
jgi:hypothetical protein